MRTTRLIAGTVSAGLLGLTPIAIAAPSQAADTWTTTTVATPSVAQLEYGDDFYVSVDLASSDGYSPGSTDGTVTLMAQEAGSAAWVPVATAENTYASFYDVKPQMNTAYKVVYSGFTDPDQGTYGDNYTPSESAPFTIGVARKITRPSSGFVIKGKVTPRLRQEEDRHQGLQEGEEGLQELEDDQDRQEGQVQGPAAPPRRHLVLVVHGQG